MCRCVAVYLCKLSDIERPRIISTFILSLQVERHDGHDEQAADAV